MMSGRPNGRASGSRSRESWQACAPTARKPLVCCLVSSCIQIRMHGLARQGANRSDSRSYREAKPGHRQSLRTVCAWRGAGPLCPARPAIIAKFHCLRRECPGTGGQPFISPPPKIYFQYVNPQYTDCVFCGHSLISKNSRRGEFAGGRAHAQRKGSGSASPVSPFNHQNWHGYCLLDIQRSNKP